MKRLSALVPVIFAVAATVRADVPQTINYQGRLTDDSGPVTDTVEMTFTIYDAETNGNSKWTEPHPSVSVVNGLFNIILGTVEPMNDTVFSGAHRWLEIVVDGEIVAPRTKLASNPYAFQANWTRTGNVLYTSGEWGISRAGNLLLGEGDSTHVNLGIACTTGQSGSDWKYATISGGCGNTAIGNQSTVGGGFSNTAYGDEATVAGGYHNTAGQSYSTVGGGRWNEAGTLGATVCGGEYNAASASVTTIGGGYYNTASGDGASVSGGFHNDASGDHTTVGGGMWNTASGERSTIGGGLNNEASSGATSIGGGELNKASQSHATVSGGHLNVASGMNATVGGGESDSASGTASVVSGGTQNTASGIGGVVSGGTDNTASANYSVVSGGFDNTASGFYSVVSGGIANTATANYSVVSGGADNTADGYYSQAGGQQAKAIHGGCFVWADYSNSDFQSTGENQFLIRAAGGVGIGTNSPSEQLEVAGTIYSASGGFRFPDGSVQTTAAGGDPGHWNVADSVLYTNSYWGLARGGADNLVTSSDQVCLGASCTTMVSHCVISGGLGNLVQAYCACIGGGTNNRVYSPYATVGGGNGNFIDDGTESVIAGGYQNAITGVEGSHANWSAICGGDTNSIQAAYCFVGGGDGNTIVSTSSGESAICGGRENSIDASSGSFIGGGFLNNVTAHLGVVVGGASNTVGGQTSIVCGGANNDASGFRSGICSGHSNHAGYNTEDSCTFVGGGDFNRASAKYSTVSGGRDNLASGDFSAIPGGYGNQTHGACCFAAGRRAFANHNGTFVWADTQDFIFGSLTPNEFAARATGGVRFVTGIDISGNPDAGVQVAAGGGSWSSICDRNLKENFSPVNGKALLEKLSAIPVTTWNYKSQDPSIRHIGPMAQDFYATFGVGENDRHITTIDADGVALAAIKELAKQNSELRERVVQLEVLVETLLARQYGSDQPKAKLGMNR